MTDYSYIKSIAPSLTPIMTDYSYIKSIAPLSVNTRNNKEAIDLLVTKLNAMGVHSASGLSIDQLVEKLDAFHSVSFNINTWGDDTLKFTVGGNPIHKETLQGDAFLLGIEINAQRRMLAISNVVHDCMMRNTKQGIGVLEEPHTNTVDTSERSYEALYIKCYSNDERNLVLTLLKDKGYKFHNTTYTYALMRYYEKDCTIIHVGYDKRVISVGKDCAGPDNRLILSNPLVNIEKLLHTLGNLKAPVPESPRINGVKTRYYSGDREFYIKPPSSIWGALSVKVSSLLHAQKLFNTCREVTSVSLRGNDMSKADVNSLIEHDKEVQRIKTQ